MGFDDLDYDKITELLKQRDEEERLAALKKKKNVRGVLLTAFSLIPWVIMIAVWVLIEIASPDREMMFFRTFFDVHDQHFTVDPFFRHNWNYGLIYAAYVLMLISLGLCLIAFTINILGKRREGEKIKVSVFIIGGITITAFVFFIINFWPVIF